MYGPWNGTGHPVVLLHGQPGAGCDWDPVVAHLGGVRAVAPDRPGYDGTPAQDFAGNARALASFADASGVGRLVVVGHSWAGGVALQLALDRPDLVAGLCLIGSVGSPLAVGPSDRLWALPGLRRLAGLAVCCGAVVSPGRFVNATGSTLPASGRAAVRESGRRWLREGSASSFAQEQAFLVRDSARLSARLAEIQPPAFILTGDTDKTVSPAASADLAARLPNGHLHILDGGHLLPVEAPQLVAEWMAQCVKDAFW